MAQRRPQRFWRRIIEIGWITACVGVLVRSLAYRNADAVVTEFFMLLALSWPVSLGAMWGYVAMLEWIPTEGPTGILLMWCFFFVVGYVQWFVIVPFVACGLRRMIGERAPPSVVPKD